MRKSGVLYVRICAHIAGEVGTYQNILYIVTYLACTYFCFSLLYLVKLLNSPLYSSHLTIVRHKYISLPCPTQFEYSLLMCNETLADHMEWAWNHQRVNTTDFGG